MEILQQFLIQTPWYVWAILVWVVIRGVKARQAGETTLLKMLTIPLVFAAWGISDLVRVYGASPDATALWLLGIAIGSTIGWWIVGRFAITVDVATGVFHRPADMSLLPLLLATFAIKYAFGVVGAVAPHLLGEPLFRISDLVLSGAFTGIFVGKFLHYGRLWHVARQATVSHS